MITKLAVLTVALTAGIGAAFSGESAALADNPAPNVLAQYLDVESQPTNQSFAAPVVARHCQPMAYEECLINGYPPVGCARMYCPDKHAF